METKTSHVWRAALSGSLIGGVLGAPIVWAVHLQLVYVLVKHAQRTQHYTALHVVTAVCLLISLGCGVLSWIDWRRAGKGSLEAPNDGRCRFLGLLGMFSGGFFSVVIVATGLAAFYFNASWD